MNPVQVGDLEARFRPLVGTEVTVAEALLDDAWAILVSSLPDIDARMTSGATNVALVRSVVSSMVLRVLRNPDGVRTWSVDDYSQTRDASVAGGSLYLSADELALLNGRASSARRGAFSVAPAPVEPVRSPAAEWWYGYAPGYLR